MKKRLLALVLCLVMASSLLPITAAAYTDEQMLSWIEGITANGTYCGDTYFTISVPNDMELGSCYWIPVSNGGQVKLNPDNSESYMLAAGSGAGLVSVSLKYIGSGHEFEPGHEFFIKLNGLTINLDHDWSDWTSNGDGAHSRSCKNGCGTTPQTASCADNNADCKCDDCGESKHTWQFKAAGNTLTGTCGSANCDIGEISLTLKADSVTLPTSPFNARLEGLEQFKAAIPNAVIGNFVYKYKGPGDSEYSVVAPSAANAKAGEYQVGVRIENLPGPVESDGPVAMAFGDNQDGTWYADLYVKYTAVDPAVTAQTGDNRPIELMMASVLVFSALAAAAFVLDSKRKYSR